MKATLHTFHHKDRNHRKKRIHKNKNFAVVLFTPKIYFDELANPQNVVRFNKIPTVIDTISHSPSREAMCDHTGNV